MKLVYGLGVAAALYAMSRPSKRGQASGEQRRVAQGSHAHVRSAAHRPAAVRAESVATHADLSTLPTHTEAAQSVKHPPLPHGIHAEDRRHDQADPRDNHVKPADVRQAPMSHPAPVDVSNIDDMKARHEAALRRKERHQEGDNTHVLRGHRDRNQSPHVIADAHPNHHHHHGHHRRRSHHHHGRRNHPHRR